ncbi:unnamed protein product [Rotaria magnacalcarata]|uniref:Uncharacterized protein n=2 Tax=Rotaria magnacalcarata TaxID=392030 RepID=A0A814Y9B1_9BILA|nr:unnamed protein product [Rotaria magnacalcarata]CAF1311658.1 unnamed protein product [Rotaria magnacalcarata]CAF4350220.1 unnamed protein product [Rotaria magnacalcarata]CAF4397274.1 unnamed protein product [Rotaria magnacalcarata]
MRNSYGGGLYGSSGFPAQFSGVLPQGSYGNFYNAGVFPNGGVSFPNGNIMRGSAFPPANFGPSPMPNPFRSGFDGPVVISGAGSGFPNQQYPFNYGPPPPIVDPNRFGSGSYDRPRSRRASRHRSQSRNRRIPSRSSSSDDEYRRRGSPFVGSEPPHYNMQPYGNAPQRVGSPYLIPRAGSPYLVPRAGSPYLIPRAGSPALPSQGPAW